jgi:hypothetical protein
MRVCITTVIDLESGDYEVTFKNVSQPGTPMDAQAIAQVWRKVLLQLAAGKAQPERPPAAPN